MTESLPQLQLGPLAIDFPVVQAPLSGYSDWPMRVIARRLGAAYTVCEVMLDQFMEVLSTCTAATVEHGGTTTHHHAVGRFHRPFYDKQRPELFAKALRGAKRELDPKGMMNPGVLIDP